MSQEKETSLEHRNLILKLKGEKKSFSEITKIVKKTRSTVQTIYRNYVMRGNVLNTSQCGLPHKLSDRDARAIVGKVKKIQQLVLQISGSNCDSKWKKSTSVLS
ncbi:hypothetical protein TNCT_348161 [Trichonephila clavata]|uniref:Uncharacterized protein n=1 Tax=Trichonephila clavata TaxID=2740835 RepID=A0A8X6H275_TRICU|nr:hypothetical protein TNCT_348161 [Trichonephila clavata]